MEHRRDRTHSRLLRRAGLCFLHPDRFEGEDAEPQAAPEPTVPGLDGEDHRAAAREIAGHQWNAEASAYCARIRGFSVFSDDVPPRLSEWRRVLSLRAAEEDRRQPVAGRIVQESLRARTQTIWRNPAVQGHLPPFWQCGVLVLCE